MTQGITTRSKALCPDGCGIQPVIGVNGTVTLACGHSRGQLLERRPGTFSIEELASRSAKDQKAAHALFPANKNGEATALPVWREMKEIKAWL